MPDIPVQDIGLVLDEVTTKIPKLINAVMTSLYSPEIGKSMGQAVGNLYKELKDSGVDENTAIQMAKDYMLTLKGITESIRNKG